MKHFKKIICLLLFLGIIVSIGTISTRAYRLISYNGDTEALDIPSKESIYENGYPINERGETYGPDLSEWTDSPDLILVQNRDGIVGYIRKSDLNGPYFDDPTEAAFYQQKLQCIDIFMQDGVTKIGEFSLDDN